MKTKTFTLFAAIIILIALNIPQAWAQTNVSGGIFSNTTWTLANSPYIVTDTVVVFPNVTLTIEPGVEVKFDVNKQLEIRQGILIAEGTASDSIVFTSNTVPISGVWGNVHLNNAINSSIKYCSFRYADKGLYVTSNLYGYHIYMSHLNFEYNNWGIHDFTSLQFHLDSCRFANNSTGLKTKSSYLNNCSIHYNQVGALVNNSDFDNCTITNNGQGINFSNGGAIRNSIINSNTQEGIFIEQGGEVYNCEIKNNGIGITNQRPTNFITKNVIENNDVGVIIEGYGGLGINMYCNQICNTTYNLKYLENYGNNGSVAGNSWCSTDSATIAAKVYDGYDNFNLQLASFMPVDTFNCYMSSGLECSAGYSLYPDNVTPLLWYVMPSAGGIAPFTYDWDWGDGSTASGLGISHTYSAPGYYNICLTITDSAGCVSTYCDASTYINKTNMNMIQVNVVNSIPTGIDTDETIERSVQVFPNPSSSHFNVLLTLAEVENVNLSLHNQLGQQVLTRDVTTSSSTLLTELDVSKLSEGVYFLTIRGDNWMSTERLIKQ